MNPRAYTLTETFLALSLFMVLLGGLLPMGARLAGQQREAATYLDDLGRASALADRLAAAVRAGDRVLTQTPDGLHRSSSESLVLGLPDGTVEAWVFAAPRSSQPPLPGRLTRWIYDSAGQAHREDLGWLSGLVLRYDKRRPERVLGITIEVELSRGSFDAPAQALSTRALLGNGEALR